MSEYQYFEFQTVDRALTKEEMSELRAYSSRATINSHSFSNEYHWGDFKGDEDQWMEDYFDAFLYYANWGTHILKLRIPATGLDLKTIQLYSDGESVSVREHDDKLIIDFRSESENGGDWEEGGLNLSTFIILRNDLQHGDLRCLYLGWLSSLPQENNQKNNEDEYDAYDEYDKETLEPPIPPGLQSLSPALIELADFLRVDADLIHAAAKKSPSLESMTPHSQDLQQWLHTLSQMERDSMLTEVLESSMKGDFKIALSYINRFNQAWRSQKGRMESHKQRTVDELLKEAHNDRQKRIQHEAQKAALERAEREQLKRMSREKRLNEITGHEDILWSQIETLICEKNAKSYDKAIELLTDLRDLARREKKTHFSSKLTALKIRHSAKSSLIRRLQDMAVL